MYLNPIKVGAFLGGVLLATAAYAQQPSGAVATTDVTQVCAKDSKGHFIYTRSHRFWRNKPQTLAKAGIPLTDKKLYEDDDIVPICLGGDNLSPDNHIAQKWDEAKRKDRLEKDLCRQVCSGKLDLSVAQSMFLNDNWRQSYMKVFGEQP